MYITNESKMVADAPAEDPPALTTPAPILPRKAELTTPPSKPPQEQNHST